MAEWSVRRTRNLVVPGSSPALATAGFVFGRPEFKSSDTLITSKLVAPCQLRFLIRFGLFVSYTYLSGVPVN